MKLRLALSAFVVLVAAPAFAVDPTNIPACDALLKKYETCSAQLDKKQVHQAQKELLDAAMSLRGAAADAKMRPELEYFCNERFALMKKTGDIAACMSAPDEPEKK